MAPSSPQHQPRPHATITFDLPALAGEDFGGVTCQKIEFKGMVNNGYIVRAVLYDAHYNMLNKFIAAGYFQEVRKKPVEMTFKLQWSAQSKYPATATQEQKAIVLSVRGLEAGGNISDIGLIEIVAIDPPSWYLNVGIASGGVYKGKVSDVIKKVIEEYAPKVKLDIGETTDSDDNKWWMMRQDPRTFISSLSDWSSSITKKKTQWLIIPNGYDLTIKEQAVIKSEQRAIYELYVGVSSIQGWDLIGDNALSITQTKIVTQGCAAISGIYHDKITDKKEEKLVAKDSTTENKQIAKVKKEKSFTKPVDTPGEEKKVAGWSSVLAIPEIYSAGDLGLQYDDYIDGRPRGMWLNMMNNLLRCKFKVRGHGEWDSCKGLGTDTFHVTWMSPTTDKNSGLPDPETWFLHGNWLIYGFHHVLKPGNWYTYLFASRFDFDAKANKVGSGS